jgi:hypothetical protein
MKNLCKVNRMEYLPWLTATNIVNIVERAFTDKEVGGTLKRCGDK